MALERTVVWLGAEHWGRGAFSYGGTGTIACATWRPTTNRLAIRRGYQNEAEAGDGARAMLRWVGGGKMAARKYQVLARGDETARAFITSEI